MRKLKLESLQVESFATTVPDGPPRGTVEGHAEAVSRACPGTGPSNCVICYATNDFHCTYDVKACGETNYLDCTFGCSQYNSCQICWVDNSKKCEID